jgi:glycosyltransferase involved in cell wall biosynthesis
LFLKKYNLPSTYFFYPAQFWPHKNHFALLKALKILDEKYHIDVALVLTGSDKGNAGYVASLIKELGLRNKVHILGFIPQVDLACLYQFALALVFPSYFGPDNLPPLEAFALGCPVIASDVPGASEQLGEAALLVKPNDINHIALAMKRVYEDADLRHELAQKGLARGKAWTTDDYVSRMLLLLDDFEPVRNCWPSSTSISHRSLC